MRLGRREEMNNISRGWLLNNNEEHGCWFDIIFAKCGELNGYGY